MRYWAATGMVILGAGAAPARAALQQAAAQDPSPYVRIASAEALCRIGEPASGVPVLAALLAEDGPWQVRLHAIEALDALGEAACLARAAIAAAEGAKNDYLGNAGRYLGRVLDGTFDVNQPVYKSSQFTVPLPR